MAFVRPGSCRLNMRVRSGRHQVTVAQILENRSSHELDMRGRSVRVQSQLRMTQTLEKTGGRGLNVQAPEGRDARGGLRVWKEPHERKLEVVEHLFGQLCL
jgi:hypothetical protein